MICFGTDVATSEPVTLEFNRAIESVRTVETEPAEPGTELNEADTLYLAPGFIDLQVNGFAGVDFNDPHTPIADIGRALDAILTTGVTRFLPTVITGSPAGMLTSLRNLRRAQRELPRGFAIAGFHVEGPYIGAEDGPRGAHPANWVRPPDTGELEQWQDATDGNIRLVTLSPHWPEAPGFIKAAVGAGIAAAIGHTGANARQIARAVDAGATLSTHIGNATYRLILKQPNCIWDQLADDRLSASFIVDGFHLDESFLRVALRAKGVERTVLVTDAAAPAGAAPGSFRLGELDVELTPDHRVVLAGTQKLAGSALRMDRAIANLMQSGRVSLRDAVHTATTNPARVIGLEGRKRGLQAGDRGDVVVFRKTSGIEIEAVYLEGERVL
jgi:N-acetylglucosamine-6-phosphate deacetylase